MSSFIFAKLIRKVLGIPVIKDSTIDRNAKVDSFTCVTSSVIGRYSYAGEYTSIIHTSVGSFTSIASNCSIGGASHPVDWVSTSPVFYGGKCILHTSLSDVNVFDPFTETKIGSDVWIGSHCIVKAGVTIGDGAVIGMGSVVTKDVGSYEIWAGNPAQKIRDRFPESVSDYFRNDPWFLWETDKIKRYAEFFNEPVKLINELNKQEGN